MYGKVRPLLSEAIETLFVSVPGLLLAWYIGTAWQREDQIGAIIGLAVLVPVMFFAYRACQYLEIAFKTAERSRQIRRLTAEVQRTLMNVRILDQYYAEKPTEENGQALDQASDEHYVAMKKLEELLKSD